MVIKQLKHQIAFSCGLLLMLGSCNHAPIKKVVTPTWNAKDIEARLYDVPFFVKTQITEESGNLNEEGGIITLLVDVPLEQLYLFYLREMEWFGWECRASINNGKEALLSYEKPHKFCIISLRAVTVEKTRLVIGTGIKKPT